MAVKFIGLKDLKNELAKIERSVKQVNNTPIKELLPSNFLKQYTIFSSLEEMFALAKQQNLDIENMSKWNYMQNKEWDEFIRKTTTFPTWKLLLERAHGLWIKKKIKL